MLPGSFLVATCFQEVLLERGSRYLALPRSYFQVPLATCCFQVALPYLLPRSRRQAADLRLRSASERPSDGLKLSRLKLFTLHTTDTAVARCVDVLGLRTGCASLRNAEFRIMAAVHCVSLVPVRCGPLRLVLDVLEAQPRSRCRGPRESTVLRLVRVRLELRLRLRLRLRRRRRLRVRARLRARVIRLRDDLRTSAGRPACCSADSIAPQVATTTWRW